MIDLSEPEFVCGTCSTSTKEGWGVEDVYELQGHKQDHNQVQISSIKDG